MYFVIIFLYDRSQSLVVLNFIEVYVEFEGWEDKTGVAIIEGSAKPQARPSLSSFKTGAAVLKLLGVMISSRAPN